MKKSEVAVLASSVFGELFYGVLAYEKWGFTYLYQDGITHAFISNVSWHNPTNLVGVWLPLPHLLMMPFVLVPFLYSSGLAGAIINSFAVGLTALIIYRIISSWQGAVIAFCYSFGILTLAYSTADLTEPLAVFFGLWAIYEFQKYLKEERRMDFLKTALILSAGELVRYEIWALALFIVAYYVFNEVRNQRNYNIGLVHVAFWGILLWLFAEAAIFRNPIEFLYPSVGSQYGVGGIASPASGGATFVEIYVLGKARETYEITFLSIGALLLVLYKIRSARQFLVRPNTKRLFALLILSIYLLSLPIQATFFLNGVPVDSFQSESTYTNIAGLRSFILNMRAHAAYGTILVSNTPAAPAGYASLLSVMAGVPYTNLIDEYSGVGLFYNSSITPWKYANYVVIISPFDVRWVTEQNYYGAFFDYLFYVNQTWRGIFLDHYSLGYNESGLAYIFDLVTNQSLSSKAPT